MSKFFMFGMPLSQMIACATVNAARVFPAFDDRGTLNVGAPADVAIMELREGTFEFVDNYKGTRTGRQRLFPIATVLNGKRAPARASGQPRDCHVAATPPSTAMNARLLIRSPRRRATATAAGLRGRALWRS